MKPTSLNHAIMELLAKKPEQSPELLFASLQEVWPCTRGQMSTSVSKLRARKLILVLAKGAYDSTRAKPVVYRIARNAGDWREQIKGAI